MPRNRLCESEWRVDGCGNQSCIAVSFFLDVVKRAVFCVVFAIWFPLLSLSRVSVCRIEIFWMRISSWVSRIRNSQTILKLIVFFAFFPSVSAEFVIGKYYTRRRKFCSFEWKYSKNDILKNPEKRFAPFLDKIQWRYEPIHGFMGYSHSGFKVLSGLEWISQGFCLRWSEK